MKIGILGGGQLAQLLAHSAYGLGLTTCCFVDESEVPAARTSPLFLGQLDDKKKLEEFARSCDVITLENENVDVDVLQFLTTLVPVYPGVAAVSTAQDRLLEKELFKKLSIPTVPFFAVESIEDLEQAMLTLNNSAILKTRRFGYDGKGQVLIQSPEDIVHAWQNIGKVPAILEAYTAFDYEVSLIAARNRQGELIYYPLSKNTHDAGILRLAECPYNHPVLQEKAQDYAKRVLQALDYVGVFAFEFFVHGAELLANEIAPRVHNSGHASIEGFDISQFESHLRAVTNLPLLEPTLSNPTLMVNIIGSFPELTNEDYQRMHVYRYGKAARPGRKLGHITFTNPDQFLMQRWQNIESQL